MLINVVILKGAQFAPWRTSAYSLSKLLRLRSFGLSLSDSLRMTCWGKIATSEEGAGTRGGKRGAGVHQGEQKKAGGDAEALSEPAERKAHRELQDRGDDGEGGLRASHEVAGHDGH